MRLSSVRGVEDMATLEDLHDGAIMHNLFLRYQQRHIYVSLSYWEYWGALGSRPGSAGGVRGRKQDPRVSFAAKTVEIPAFSTLKAKVDVTLAATS